jgi:hypothetical protein
MMVPALIQTLLGRPPIKAREFIGRLETDYPAINRERAAEGLPLLDPMEDSKLFGWTGKFCPPDHILRTLYT